MKKNIENMNETNNLLNNIQKKLNNKDDAKTNIKRGITNKIQSKKNKNKLLDEKNLKITNLFSKKKQEIIDGPDDNIKYNSPLKNEFFIDIDCEKDKNNMKNNSLNLELNESDSIKINENSENSFEYNKAKKENGINI